MFAVCKHKRMTHPLKTFIDTAQTSQARLAQTVGISRGYMSELVSGTKTPSLDLAFAIEAATAGAVPAASWVAGAQTTGAQ